MSRIDADDTRNYSTFTDNQGISKSDKYGSFKSMDDALLESMGYEQQLHRGLNMVSNFAFGFTEVAILASLTSLYGYGLKTGGNLTFSRKLYNSTYLHRLTEHHSRVTSDF